MDRQKRLFGAKNSSGSKNRRNQNPSGEKDQKWFCNCLTFRYDSIYGVDMKDVPLNRNAPFEYYIMDKADNITIPFELIVCFHYICEQLAENPDVDPLEGTIPKDPNYSNLYSL